MNSNDIEKVLIQKAGHEAAEFYLNQIIELLGIINDLDRYIDDSDTHEVIKEINHVNQIK